MRVATAFPFFIDPSVPLQYFLRLSSLLIPFYPRAFFYRAHSEPQEYARAQGLLTPPTLHFPLLKIFQRPQSSKEALAFRHFVDGFMLSRIGMFIYCSIVSHTAFDDFEKKFHKCKTLLSLLMLQILFTTVLTMLRLCIHASFTTFSKLIYIYIYNLCICAHMYATYNAAM